MRILCKTLEKEQEKILELAVIAAWLDLTTTLE